MTLRPTPETTQADDSYGPFIVDGADLLEHLVAAGARVEKVVPQCVGLSVTLAGDGPTYTLTTRTVLDASVTSTLSLPVFQDGREIAHWDIYATTKDAFVGLHEKLARDLGAELRGTTVDTDLGFLTHGLARRTPGLLQESTRLAVAVALIGAVHDRGPEDAEVRLRAAAVRAGTSLSAVVEVVVDVLLEN